MLSHLNHRLYLLLNAPTHPGFVLVACAKITAGWLVYLAMVLLVMLWVRGRADRRGRLLASTGGVFAALGINQLLGMIWYEPRPFVIGLGHTLIRHAADNAFPSDHATFMWSLGLGLIVTGAARRWGAAIWLGGLAVAWARIFLGVHYPLDMLASFLVAPLGAAIGALLIPAMERWALPPLDFLYCRCLRWLRLPAVLFPMDRAASPDGGQADHR
ncbi:MAG: undecaprenyl-diphosphatase [Rhodospirillales bacterium]|nr:undecaprenyl-diphosphatase [Rhodospirillales bacterium]